MESGFSVLHCLQQESGCSAGLLLKAVTYETGVQVTADLR